MDDIIRPRRKVTRPLVAKPHEARSIQPVSGMSKVREVSFRPDIINTGLYPTKPRPQMKPVMAAHRTEEHHAVHEEGTAGTVTNEAAEEKAEPITPTDHPQEISSDKQASKPKRHMKFWPFYRRRDLFFVLLGLVLLTGVGMAAWFKFVYIKPVKQPTVTLTKKAAPPVPKTVASPLTGVQVDPELAKRVVTGVMIENSPEARPQSGLKDAGVVFEAIAEGGITRFLALFQESNADYIGPVRSVRPYYLDWALAFDAPVAHVGGSPDALSQIKSLGVKDLDQFANGSYYQRITSRYAPHNVYTSIAKLNELENSKGFTTSTFTGFSRKSPAKATTPTARSIDLAISSYAYNVHYDYDVPTNSYKRSEGGEAHTDERSATQLAPNVVVALVMNRSIMADGIHSDYTTVGSGQMYVFQDGQVTTGTWLKADRKASLVFHDSSGQDIQLNAGQTWISIVPTAASVTYKP